MPPWLRLLGLPLVAVPLLLLWERPDLLAFRPVGGTFRPSPAPLPPLPRALPRALPNAEHCVVVETVPGGFDIGFTTTTVPPARARVLWWCDDDRVYWS